MKISEERAAWARKEREAVGPWGPTAGALGLCPKRCRVCMWAAGRCWCSRVYPALPFPFPFPWGSAPAVALGTINSIWKGAWCLSRHQLLFTVRSQAGGRQTKWLIRKRCWQEPQESCAGCSRKGPRAASSTRALPQDLHLAAAPRARELQTWRDPVLPPTAGAGQIRLRPPVPACGLASHLAALFVIFFFFFPEAASFSPPPK